MVQIAQWDQRAGPLLEDTLPNRVLLHQNARTLLVESKPVAAMGVWPIWQGVGRAWAVLSGDALRYPVMLTRGARGFLHEIEARDGYRRIEATIERGHDRGRRWALRLGFVYEATLQSYGPTGIDHDLYVHLGGR